ncbi:hypothetical protein KSP39_PZI002195 [Platanthera zijinensis]|uniref:DUF4219 domain-containing protein n=1 Tax=Platanthera zijinensis TaxID=2320716 RepID=A0AAP0GEU3_9ASPA
MTSKEGSEDPPRTGSYRGNIQYPVLTRSNYGVWSMKMKVFISVQEAWEAIEPSDPNGVVDAGMNHRDLTALYQSVPDDILLMLGDKSAKEAWETLKTMNLGADRVKEAKLQTLKSEFKSLRMRDADTVEDFALKLTTNVNKQRELGDKLEEVFVVKKFLRSVPSKFIQLASTIEQFGDLQTMTMEEIIGRLKTHEERIRGNGESEDG